MCLCLETSEPTATVFVENLEMCLCLCERCVCVFLCVYTVHSCTWVTDVIGSHRAWDLNRSEPWEAAALWGMESGGRQGGRLS